MPTTAQRLPRRLPAVIALALSSLAVAASAAAPVTITADRADGIYAVGDTVRWTIQPNEAFPRPLRFTVKRSQRTEVSAGELHVIGDGATATVTAVIDQPGTLLLALTGQRPDGAPVRAYAAAAGSIDQLKPAAEPPADFNAFWASKVAELQAVPMNPQIDPTLSTQPIDPKVEYHKLTLDNIRGSRVHAQLARPAAGEKFPALLVVQWAGVYGLQPAWATDRAKDGWLILNVNPHDLPIDRPPEFYKEQSEGALKNYNGIGNDDRDTSYFLRMYLSCYRAADYLMSRPDWDGKTLVVMGTSQGGMQSLMLAGLHPKITAALANVPAGFDMLAEEVGRRAGYPFWIGDGNGGKDPAKVREAARYYDVTNFARRIKCPTLVGVGLIDDLCPADGIVAGFNGITAPKELVVMPLADHQGVGGTQKAYEERCYGAWLPALRQGLTPAGLSR